MGIGFLGSARGVVTSNTVASTSTGTIRDDLTLNLVTLGDGIAVTGKSSATVETNTAVAA